MDNVTRRNLLQRHKQSGFPGSIMDVYKAFDQGIDLIGQFEQQQQLQKHSVASTPQEQRAGLRPAHQAGNVNQSMVFPNVSPNASFNTIGMKAPIDIKQFSPQGNLVRSFDAVPPGVTNLKMGSEGGMVLETPTQMKNGGIKKYQNGTPVRNLLNTLEAQDPYLAASQNVEIAQNQLTDEEQRVLNVRNNVIPAAESLSQRQQDILEGITPEHRRANDYYYDMQNLSRRARGGEDINVSEELKRMQNSSEFPQMLRDVLPSNGMYNVSQIDPNYDTHRQVYCTPYGCLPYQQAGATDVPNVHSNPKFKAGVENGSLPFARINAIERSPGDIALVVGSAPREYSNPDGPWVTRPHHTTIYAGDETPESDDPEGIVAYNARNGVAMNFGVSNIHRENAPLEFYRYIGQTPQMRQNLNYANDVYEAIGTKPLPTLDPLTPIPIQELFVDSYTNSLKLDPSKSTYKNRSASDVAVNKNGGIRKAQNALPPFSLEQQPIQSESTFRPNYGEQAFLNQMNATPQLTQPKSEPAYPHPPQTFLNQDNRTDAERKLADAQINQTLKRQEAIERGVNPNLAFMYPQSLQGDSQAMAAYQYDNPMSSPIGLATNALAGASTARLTGSAANIVNNVSSRASDVINAGLNYGTNAIARTAPVQYLGSTGFGRGVVSGANYLQSGIKAVGKPFTSMMNYASNTGLGRATTSFLDSGTGLFGASTRDVLGAYGKAAGVLNAPDVYNNLMKGNILGAASGAAKLPIGTRGFIPSAIGTIKNVDSYVSAGEGLYGIGTGQFTSGNVLKTSKALPGTTPFRIGYGLGSTLLEI